MTDPHPAFRPFEYALGACGIFSMLCAAGAFKLAGNAMTKAGEAEDLARSRDAALEGLAIEVDQLREEVRRAHEALDAATKAAVGAGKAP